MNASRVRRRLSWPVLRLAGLLIGVGLVVAAVAWPRAGDPATRPVYTGSPGPTFNLPAALDAPVDSAGLMRTGGMWVVQGSYLLTSLDNGETWRAGTFPYPGDPTAASSVFVLDAQHAWAVGSVGPSGLGSGPASVAASPASGPAADRLFTLTRTTDGGRTWESAPVSGDFRCDSATLSFVDADRGFAMCSVGSLPGPDGPVDQSRAGATRGSGTVLQTVDGGATWSVAGGSTGLGSQFTASDADTLWSAPDRRSSQLSGAALYFSSDAGATWSPVALPDIGSVAPNTQVDVQAGPVFWDASNGAFAVSVYLCCSVDSAAVWFYRTSDGGKSWSVVKKPMRFPPNALPGDNAAVGKIWAVVGDSSLFSLTVSADFGASWTNAHGFGMPDNTSFLSVDLADRDHGLSTVFVFQGERALMLTADGGRTWHAADFGDARAKVPASSVLDPITARSVATDFVTMASKYPPNAWNNLSSYSQRQFGSESAFEAAEAALFKSAGYSFRVGDPTRNFDILSRSNVGDAVWSDLITFADMTRAYVVPVTFPGASEPAQALVVAPLSVTGGWRVWIAAASTPVAQPSARAG